MGAKGCTLISPDLQGFKVEKNHIGFLSQDESVEVLAPASSGVIVIAGVKIDAGMMEVHLTGGGGYLFNNAFNIGVITAETDLLFKLGENFTMGPRAGIVFYEPTWTAEDGEVTLTSDEPGAIFGLGGYYSWNGSKIRVGGNIDYQTGKIEVETDDGWTANDYNLDLSGIAIRFGAAFSF